MTNTCRRHPKEYKHLTTEEKRQQRALAAARTLGFGTQAALNGDDALDEPSVRAAFAEYVRRGGLIDVR